ncbi:hypothetical protein [Meiothermus sp. Pnk-1]|uniref:hypothetical protein n=1 Tax=Meiothermus sp. Pnk-1 TaxID=873128 RepID=UPI000D7CC73A|nr:hypothetical protein [Meiothermus sp. Pnk-1]PZA08917.1 hypothetical protein DNA98_02480 [Meiothermus sp. Pnk-1]
MPLRINPLRFGPWLLGGFALLFPLAFLPGTLLWPVKAFDDPISASKELFILLPKLMLLVLAGVVGLLSVKSWLRQYWREAFPVLLLIHLLLVGLSSLNARDEWAFTLLGPSRRLDGLIYQAALASWLLFVYCLLRRRPEAISLALWGVFISGIIEAISVILSYYQLDPLPRLIYFLAPQNHPFEGTIGNYGMLAGFLLAATIAGLWLSWERGSWVLLGLVPLGMALGIGSNRSTLLGILLVLIALNIALRSKQVFLMSLLLATSSLAARELPAPLKDWRDIGSFSTGQSRIYIWKLTMAKLREIPLAPWLGGGPDALRLAQMRNPPLNDPNLVRIYQIELGWRDLPTGVEIYQEPGRPIRSRWLLFHFAEYKGEKNASVLVPFGVDRAHNMLLDRLVSYGLFDALLWAVLYLAPLALFRRRTPEAVLLASAALGFLGYYLFWFPVVQVEPIHMVFVAMAWAMLSKPAAAKSAEEGKAELARA